MQSAQKSVKLQSITSNKIFNFTVNPSITLCQLRQKLKNLQFNLSPFIFRFFDKSPIPKSSQSNMSLQIILCNNIFYVKQHIQQDKQLNAAIPKDIRQQIYYTQTLKKYQQFQQKILQLKERINKFKTTFIQVMAKKPVIDENYQGQVNQFGKYHGIGCYHYDNGQIHRGYFMNGVRHGLGYYTFNSGDRYQGEYKNNVADGLGTQVFSSGHSMAAIYKNNSSNGMGIYYYSNGQKILGAFKQNHFQGIGIKIDVDGTWKKERYEHGEFLEQLQ